MQKTAAVRTVTDAPVSLDLLGFVARIVSAYVSNITVDSADILVLIGDVYRSLSVLGESKVLLPQQAPANRRIPAVPIRKSIFADHIVCLEDGKKLKMLKRHLKSAYHLTPEQYRERWGLPADYPMVAPDYASHRSRLAKRIGLGTKPRRGR